MLDQILSVLLLGAVVSAIYALVAIGFTMIFGVGGVLNLAHGGLIMFGAYAYVVLTSSSVVGAIAVPPAAGSSSRLSLLHWPRTRCTRVSSDTSKTTSLSRSSRP